jgi:hypothetical protein
MAAQGSQPPPPFQFGLRFMFGMTAAVAIVCSLIMWLRFSWELAGLLLPCACFVGYQACYALVSRCMRRSSWDGANHAAAAVLATILVAVVLLVVLLFVLWIMS